jgi:Putative polyhydroxyalkanoic acid system protein (PHA_gran_rgn)
MLISAAGKAYLLQRKKGRLTVPAEPQGEKPWRSRLRAAKGAGMSNPVTVDLPHKLGAEEARRRIERNVGRLTDHIPGGATVDSRWTGDRLHLDVGAMGQQVAAEIDIRENIVRLTVKLPPALAFFGGMIEPLIRKQGAEMLEDKRKS